MSCFTPLTNTTFGYTVFQVNSAETSKTWSPLEISRRFSQMIVYMLLVITYCPVSIDAKNNDKLVSGHKDFKHDVTMLVFVLDFFYNKTQDVDQQSTVQS